MVKRRHGVGLSAAVSERGAAACKHEEGDSGKALISTNICLVSSLCASRTPPRWFCYSLLLASGIFLPGEAVTQRSG